MRGAALALATAACGRVGFTGTDADVSPYAAAVLADLPAAYFRFDELAGPTAYSQVGSLTGTYEGAFMFGAAGATRDGNASVVFDGATTRIDLGDVFRFAGNTPYSIEMWIFPTVIGDSTRFLVHRNTAAGDGYSFYIGPDYTIASRDAGDVEFGYVSTAAPALARWTHLVVTYDGAEAWLWHDGELVSNNEGNAADPIGEGSGGLSVGDRTPPQFNKFRGSIDELAIYDHALAAERVLAHYQLAQP